MSEPDKRDEKRPETEMPKTPVPKTLSPEEAAKLIRFALSELAAENAHHNFEHLCRHLTRRKICPNIIPATGPVSGGGDQGADFETYTVASSHPDEQSATQFFSRAAKEKWLFACSLERNYKKKVREDLAAANKFGEPVAQVDFFHHLPIKIADRNKLKREALQSYGIELESFDGPAIAEMLADPQTVWIAEQFLSLPSELLLQPGRPAPGWFDEILAKNYGRGEITSANFFELKDAIRFATWRPEHHSALAKLLESIQAFKGHRFPGIRRKVIYETFVASLRGLETTTGLESSLRDYFADVGSLDDVAEIEDGAVLIGYALGARMRGMLDVPLSELQEWHSKILSRIRALKDEHPTPGKLCSLLYVEGYLALNKYLSVHDGGDDFTKVFRTGAQTAIGIWHELVKKASDAPMFPIERPARLVNEFLGLLDGATGLDQLVRKIDKLSARRSGQGKIADYHVARAESFLRAKIYLRALDELHAAHSSSFAGGTPLRAATVCLQLSKVYGQMRLYFASKYYALAAAYAFLKLPDERLRRFAYTGCAEAASADYMSGGSLLYFLAARLFVILTFEYPMGGSEDQKREEWARIDFYALVLSRGAGFIFEKLQLLIVEQILPLLGLDEIYSESRSRLDDFFSEIRDLNDLAAKAISEVIAPAFSDVGGRRVVAWRQLATNWRLEWETDYETERQAEALAAYLQILLAEFARVELSIIPGDVSISIAVHDGGLEIRDVPDNERVSRVVMLPRVPNETADSLPSAAEVVAIMLLGTVSALPLNEFRRRCDAQFEKGLRNRLSVYRASEALFEEFYSREMYAQLYNIGRRSFTRPPEYVVQTWEGLDGPQGTHPKYDKAESVALAKNRYKNVIPLIQHTIKRLVAADEFRNVLSELKGHGWKDWHILMAVEHVRFNYLLNIVPGLRDLMDHSDNNALMKLRFKPEQEPELEVPADLFTAKNLKESIHFSQLATLKGLGFEVRQSTPNLDGIDRLLRRFHYWDDDAPHDNFF